MTFRALARRWRSGIVLLLCLLAVAVALGWLVLGDDMAIDRCLDRGGAWDASVKACRLP